MYQLKFKDTVIFHATRISVNPNNTVHGKIIGNGNAKYLIEQVVAAGQ